MLLFLFLFALAVGSHLIVIMTPSSSPLFHHLSFIFHLSSYHSPILHHLILPHSPSRTFLPSPSLTHASPLLFLSLVVWYPLSKIEGICISMIHVDNHRVHSSYHHSHHTPLIISHSSSLISFPLSLTHSLHLSFMRMQSGILSRRLKAFAYR